MDPFSLISPFPTETYFSERNRQPCQRPLRPDDISIINTPFILRIGKCSLFSQVPFTNRHTFTLYFPRHTLVITFRFVRVLGFTVTL